MKRIRDSSEQGWLAQLSADAPDRLMELDWFWEQSHGKVMRKSGVKGSRECRTLDIALHRAVMGQTERVEEDPETGLLRALPRFNVIALNDSYRDCLWENLYLVEADENGRAIPGMKWKRRREKIALLRELAAEGGPKASDSIYVLAFLDAWDSIKDRFLPGTQPPLRVMNLSNGWRRCCLNGDPLDTRPLNWIEYDPKGSPTRRSAELNRIDELVQRTNRGDSDADALLSAVRYGYEGYPVKLGTFAREAGLILQRKETSKDG